MRNNTTGQHGKIEVHVEGTQIGYAVYVTCGGEVTEWHTLAVPSWDEAALTRTYREAQRIASTLEYTASHRPQLIRNRKLMCK